MNNKYPSLLKLEKYKNEIFFILEKSDYLLGYATFSDKIFKYMYNQFVLYDLIYHIKNLSDNIYKYTNNPFQSSGEVTYVSYLLNFLDFESDYKNNIKSKILKEFPTINFNSKEIIIYGYDFGHNINYERYDNLDISQMEYLLKKSIDITSEEYE